MGVSIPRLRSVRFKDGRTLRVISPAREVTKRVTDHLVRQVGNVKQIYRDDLAGYALVVWDRQGASSSAYIVSDASRLSNIEMPTFVAERLRCDIIAELAQEDQ